MILKNFWGQGGPLDPLVMPGVLLPLPRVPPPEPHATTPSKPRGLHTASQSAVSHQWLKRGGLTLRMIRRSHVLFSKFYVCQEIEVFFGGGQKIVSKIHHRKRVWGVKI